MKVLIADYGLNVWYGDTYSYEDRLTMLKEIGYDGIERLHASTEAEVLENAALARKLGMHFALCAGKTVAETIKWTAALGLNYVWTASLAKDMDTFCRHVNAHIETAEKYGVTVGIHNHLGNTVETWEQLATFMEKCPKAGLILDTGHLAGAGGDPLRAIDEYFDRIVMVHLKDYVYKDKDNAVWYNRLRFCELGAGEMGDLNLEVLEKLKAKGYDKWLAVEHDTHLQDPRIDLAISREFIRRAGI